MNDSTSDVASLRAQLDASEQECRRLKHSLETARQAHDGQHARELDALTKSLDHSAEVARLQRELADLQRRYEIRKSESFQAEQALFRVAFAVTKKDAVTVDFAALADEVIACVEKLEASR